MKLLIVLLLSVTCLPAISSQKAHDYNQQQQQKQQPEITLAQKYAMAKVKKIEQEELANLRARITASKIILIGAGLDKQFSINEQDNMYGFKKGIYATDGADLVCVIHPYAQVRSCSPGVPCKMMELQYDCVDSRTGATIKSKNVY